MEKLSSQNHDDESLGIDREMPADLEQQELRGLLNNQEEMARFEKPHRKVKNPSSRIKNYLKVLLAGAVLTFGGKMVHDKYEEHVEGQAGTEYVLHSGLQEKSENMGFNLKVDVPNNAGPYIVHVGWIHPLRGADADKVTDNILQENKNVEQLLISLKDKDVTPYIFTEGVDEKSIDFLSYFSSYRDKIGVLELNTDTVDKLIKIVSGLPKEDSQNLKISFEYLVSKKIAELKNNKILINSNKLSTLKNICEEKFGSFNEQTINDRILGDIGAGMKIFADGKYEIVPAESNKFSKETSRAFHEGKLDEESIRREIFDQRENFTVDLIKDVLKGQKIKHGYVLVLYGAGHDFSDNVRRSNESGGKGKIGLISLEPKSIQGQRE